MPISPRSRLRRARACSRSAARSSAPRAAGAFARGARSRRDAIQRGERERAASAMRAHIVTVREAYEVYAAGALAAPDRRASRRSWKYRARPRPHRPRPGNPSPPGRRRAATCRSTAARARRRRNGRSSRRATPRLQRQSRCPCPLRRGAARLWRLAAGEREQPIVGRGRRASSSRAPSAFNSPLSGMPDRCAPTTAMAISSAAGAAAIGASGGCGT